MTARDLISELEAYIEDYGNCEICVEDRYYGSSSYIGGIQYDPNEKIFIID